MNILEEVQIYVADRLNADSQLSGLCPFIFENKKDIDYEIKSALGKQGIIGLVMTPKATFAGAFEDKSLAWQVDELEVDIIENVTVNRGKKNGYVTGQDAAMRLFDVLCPLSGENEGKFNAVSYEEGEDNSLLVNKCILKCLVHHFEQPVPPDPRKTRLTYDDGRVVELALSGTIYQGHLPDLGHIVAADIGEDVTLIGESAFNLCYELTSVTLPSTSIGIGPFAFNEIPIVSLDFGDSGLTEIGMAAFEHCEQMRSASLPSTLSSIGQGAFVYCSNLDVVNFAGKTLYEISSMDNYPWGIADTNNIHNIIGPDTRVKYGWSQSWDSLPLSGTLNSNDLPSRDGIRYVGIGSSIDEIGYRAFRGIEFLTGVEIPDTVTTIGTESFAGVEGMTDIEIPSSVTSIGSNAFFGCHLLSSVTFHGKTLPQVQAMENYPWGISDTSVISAEIQPPPPPPPPPPSLTRAYYSDGTMVERDITTTLTQYTFDKTNLVRLEIGNHVLSVGFSAFGGTPTLSSVEFNEGTTSIAGNLMFNGCPALTQITIPDSVTTIGDAAFWGIPNLTEFKFPDSQVSSIGTAAFSGCSSLSSVEFGESLIEIKPNAFNLCTNLKNFNSNDGVYLNDDIQTIGARVFSGSGIEKLSFNNLAAMGIDSNAFAGCEQLSDVVVRGVTTHEAMSLENYPWGISNENIIRGDRGI